MVIVFSTCWILEYQILFTTALQRQDFKVVGSGMHEPTDGKLKKF